MNRREFGKLLAVAVLVPSLVKIPAEQPFPVKYKYKGWMVVLDERCTGWGGCWQIYAKKTINNKRYCGTLRFDKTDPLAQIEKITKIWLDRQDKRAA